MKKLVLFTSLLILLASCEDVIEIDLEGIEPKLVIEAVINDIDKTCVVKLSETVDYFNPGIYPNVSNASVSISENDGIPIVLEESEPGIYTSNNISRVENTRYLLEINTDNKSCQAEVAMPQKVAIDSLSYEETPLYLEFSDGYVVNCHFRDPLEVSNYYRLKVYNINDGQKAIDSKFLFNDDFVEGNQILLQWDVEEYYPEDTVVTELYTLDKSTYDYYNTLFLLGDNIFGSSNPGNPKTNLNNDVLGFFAAYTISRDTIIIK